MGNRHPQRKENALNLMQRSKSTKVDYNNIKLLLMRALPIPFYIEGLTIHSSYNEYLFPTDISS